jgi:hypothetical protein
MKSLNFKAFALHSLSLLLIALVTACGGSNSVPLVFTATLTGAEEVPPTPSTARGTGIVSVDPVDHTLRAAVVTTGIADTQAHIHAGPPGVSGPIVFPLTKQAGDPAWTVTAPISDEQLAALTAGQYYFNVHSPTFPDGEIRGQITRKVIDDQLRQQLEQLRDQSGAVRTEIDRLRQQQSQ